MDDKDKRQDVPLEVSEGPTMKEDYDSEKILATGRRGFTEAQGIAAGMAVMVECGCGLTVDGERIFCDDERAGSDRDSRCLCKLSGVAALTAAAQAGKEATVDVTKLNAGQLVQRIMRAMDGTSPPESTAKYAEHIAAEILKLPANYWTSAAAQAGKETIGNGAANCIGFSYHQIKGDNNFRGNLTDVGFAFIHDLEKSGYKIVKDSFIAPAPAPLSRADDKETIQTLLDLINPLHGSLDKQTYDEKIKQNFDAPADAEYAVDITAQQERDLTQAVMILEDRLRAAPPSPPAQSGEVDNAQRHLSSC